ncbi:hypothetical protein KBC77_03355, partial [Candidatus Saccharibacteria bacterium]|nr:hypothetical protein [Candidatus Saccharibacteria bacterium]
PRKTPQRKLGCFSWSACRFGPVISEQREPDRRFGAANVARKKFFFLANERKSEAISGRVTPQRKLGCFSWSACRFGPVISEQREPDRSIVQNNKI